MAVAADHDPLRPEPAKTFYDGVVRVPGYGREVGPDSPDRCRNYTPVGFCDEGHTILGRSSCGTRYCPDHWRDWCEQAVVSVVARLAAYREAVDGAEKRLSHVVASPPQDRRYSVRALWETRTEAYEALEAAGVRGGVVVTHPYRTNERGDELYQTAKDRGDLEEGTGKWRFLRESCEDWDDVGRYIEASPHYHSLSVGEDIQGDAAPDGWVVERIRSMQSFHRHDPEAYRDMAATVYYVLTHGAVQDGRSLTTYFGAVHPATFDPEEELTAAAWDRIQREAEKAVLEEPDTEGPAAAGPEECPHDGCVAAVHDIMHLGEFLDDEEWVDRVRSQAGGRKRWMQLRGAFLWWDGRTDRPPPSASMSEGRFLEWLQDRGEVHTPEPSQVSFRTAVMES